MASVELVVVVVVNPQVSKFVSELVVEYYFYGKHRNVNYGVHPRLSMEHHQPKQKHSVMIYEKV